MKAKAFRGKKKRKKKQQQFSFLQLRTVFFSLEFSTDEDEDEIDDDEDEGSSSEEFTDSIEEDVKLTAESLASTEVKENACTNDCCYCTLLMIHTKDVCFKMTLMATK